MQYRHPMHVLLLTRTTPSSVWNVAPTGQTWTQGGFAHWLHSFGTKKLRRIDRSAAESGTPSGFVSTVFTIASPFRLMMYRSTQVRGKKGSLGTSVSVLQASTHRVQPMHLSTETPKPYHFPFRGASFASTFAGRIWKTPPIALPETRNARTSLRNFRLLFTLPPPANADNDIASTRTSPRVWTGRPSARSWPTCPSRPWHGTSRRTPGSAASWALR